MTCTIESYDSYQTYLDELNTMGSPNALFTKIDTLIKSYQSLKRQYSAEWKKHQQYSSIIKNLRNKNDAITISIKDIQTVINKIKQFESSLNEWVQSVSNIINIEKQCDQRSLFVMKNIKPSYAKRRSNSKKKKKKKQKSLKEIKESDNESIESKEYQELDYTTGTLADFLPPAQSKIPKYSRHVSQRSFGELWSHQFQVEVANNYKQSIQDEKCDEATLKQRNVVQYYHDNYCGQNEVFESVFGIRPVIYADWTASGKPLECVERYLSKEMYTLYANTHTTTSITGIQTSKFRSEARSIILESLSGDIDEDVVIFTGSGVTGAIYKISRILMKSTGKSYKPETTIVFISIYEHNSNIFIWKELGCKIIVIPEENENKQKGGLDLKYLEKKLKLYTSSHLKNKYNLLIGSFTAASNVSGIIAPIEETTLLLHKYGALSFWDYATAGPYLNINMTNKDNPMLSKDAVFISTHKYLAGPGAPGILCAKKKLFNNYVPVIPGGGTVFTAFGIEDGDWEYLENIEEREEGGTPDIIGSVRAAFAFMIKDHLTSEFIQQIEEKYLSYFLKETSELNNLVLMGNTQCERLPVLSFLITHSRCEFGSVKKYLHYNFIAALFNDLFGIQGRGGCACAGMYGIYAMGMNGSQVEYFFKQLREDNNELVRPGYFRINLHYTLTENELKYIVNAVKYICKNGWKFLPLYDVDEETGNYFHRDIKRKPEILKKQLRSLLDISFNEIDGSMQWIQKNMRVKNNKVLNNNFDKFFVLADNVLDNLSKHLPTKDECFSPNKNAIDGNALYWLPSELYIDALNYN